MRRPIALVLAGSLLGGCSFFMTRAPAQDPGTRPLDCEQSMVPPGADVVGAGAFALIGLGSIAFKPDDTSTAKFVAGELVVFGIAAVFGYSAYSGHKSVKRCRALSALPATPVHETERVEPL